MSHFLKEAESLNVIDHSSINLGGKVLTLNVAHTTW